MKAKLDYKWVALALLWVAFFLQQGTRQVFSATLPSIQASFGVSRTELGVVGTVFTFMYGICVPFAGIAADLFRRKWMVTIGVAIFCGGIFWSGFAASIGLLIVSYGVLNGFGQTFYYPSATSLVGQLHRESRATAFSILQCGLYAGIVLCSAASGWIAQQGAGAWRWPYWIFGGVGIVWAVALLFFLKDTPPMEAAKTGSPGSDKASAGEALKALFAKPSAICLAIGLGMMIYVDIGFKIWMPSFLVERYGVSLGVAALNAVLWHYVGAFIGITFGSRYADRTVARRPGVRMEMNILGLVLAVPFIVWMANASSFVACCTAMGLFGVFRGVYDSNLFAALFDVVKERYHASATGLMLAFAFVFGALAPIVLGWLGDRLSMRLALSVLAAFYFVGAAVILLARVRFLKRDRVVQV